MTKTSSYRAVLVGLGNIAWGYDGGSGVPPLTHLSCLLQQSQVQLVAACSPIPSERESFAGFAKVALYDDLAPMLEGGRPDLVSVCSPTEHHFSHAMACIQAKIPMVWLEKPPVVSVKEGEELMRALSSGATTLMVGYQRRYAQPFSSIRESIARSLWGEVLSVTVHYGQKLYRNGCHGLDTVHYLLGDRDMSFMSSWAGQDRGTPSFSLLCGDVPVTFIGVAGDYHCLDWTLTFQKAQLEIRNGGSWVELREVKKDHAYPSSWLMRSTPSHPFGSLSDCNGMALSLENLIASFEAGREPVSSLSSAMKTQRIMEMVMEGLR